MKNLLHKIFGLAILMVMPGLLMAHPGHGHDNPLSPGHYIFNPEHALPVMLALVVSVAFSWILIQANKGTLKK